MTTDAPIPTETARIETTCEYATDCDNQLLTVTDSASDIAVVAFVPDTAEIGAAQVVGLAVTQALEAAAAETPGGDEQ